MEILKSKEIDKLVLSDRGRWGFRTPIRTAFEKLKVGEGVVFTEKEWHENYKTTPQSSVQWGKKMGWKVSCRSLKKEGKIKTFALVRKS